jgi:hypothetical protein
VDNLFEYKPKAGLSLSSNSVAGFNRIAWRV